MSIIIKYVVEHKGVEKLVTTDKKEADKYDKMLNIADNLATYIQGKGVELDDQLLEDLTVLMAKNKDNVSKVLRGSDAGELLESESAEVIDIQKSS